MGPADTSEILRNRLLLALTQGDRKRFMPELSHVKYDRHQVRIEADSALEDVYHHQPR
jgi:hypothetical protein